MDKFDEKVIGYDSIKETLRQIADVLKRPEAYKEKGVSMPRGLLMESAPGLGKSLMASILMEESGRKSFVFRRINEGNTFLGEMKDIFDVAKEEAPSILLLEDLNLYVESNSPYAPEWACLQACIDETSDADIFVIATTNDTRYMPQSLLRPGRFDYILNLNPPLGKTAENIVSYYLRDKNLAKDVQISDIVKAMPQVSCATLETVMNLAAINSVYRDHAHVQKEDIIDAYNSAFTSFKNNESRYKDKSQLFGLVSTTLFAYDAGRLFNETLIFYNHVYAYIFNKLDDNGKLELTKYSIECERKQG